MAVAIIRTLAARPVTSTNAEDQPTGEPPSLSSDAPIDSRNKDRFGRARIAKRIAGEAATAPTDSGFVIAVCGPWGSGKTSLINLVIEELASDDGVTVLRFNPWLFSSARIWSVGSSASWLPSWERRRGSSGASPQRSEGMRAVCPGWSRLYLAEPCQLSGSTLCSRPRAWPMRRHRYRSGETN
ncbi:MAG: hypothetical protein H0U00_12750 [Actinobacteria bacterium]|nr:hypothetical protein [Actinomycetota bacterium]